MCGESGLTLSVAARDNANYAPEEHNFVVHGASFPMTAIASAALAYTPDVAAATRPLYERVSRIIPSVEWPMHAPLVDAVNRLKRERNAVVLAHNYKTPEIFHCVAYIVGDSLSLAQRAAETDSYVIVLAGVHFMAETANLLNPEKI